MLVILLVPFAVMGGFLPESTSVGSVSPASIAIVVFFLLGMIGLNRARRRPVWRATNEAPQPETAEKGPPNLFERMPTRAVVGAFVAAVAASAVTAARLHRGVLLLTAVPG
jgi:hypothetical protein